MATSGRLKARVTGAGAAVMRMACSLAGCETKPGEPSDTGSTEVMVELGRRPAKSGVPRPGAPGAIVADGLTKVYANGVRAVDNVSLRATSGQIVAIVGPNGAGKSTTLNMLTTLVTPTSGTASILGVPITDARAVSRLVGVALQSSGLDPVMTGIEHFETQAALYQVPKALAAARTTDLLAKFSLEPFADRQVGLYSGGLQRRLALALALLHDPRVVIFDEPTAGLDPQGRRLMWSLLGNLRAEGRIILFSTQLLEEADLLSQRVYVIANGTVVAEGAPDELRALVGEVSLRVRVTGTSAEARDVLATKVPRLGPCRVEGDALNFVGGDSIREAIQDVVNVLDNEGFEVLELTLGRPSLEDAFVHLTGEAPPVEPLITAPRSAGGICRCQ